MKLIKHATESFISHVMNTVCVFDIPAFFVDNKTCLSSPLGVETGLIQDHQMRASSSYNKTTWPHFGRLAGPGAWCPKEIPYILQIKLIVLHYICAVATQGSYEHGYFATKYTLFLRTDGQGALYEDLNGNKVSNS